MATGKTKFFRADGKNYEFTQGRNGTLIARNAKPLKPWSASDFVSPSPQNRAKTVKPITGSTRG